MADQDQEITLLAVADVSVQGENNTRQFDLVRSILQGGDITFGQLETSLANSGVPQLPAQLPGGLGAVVEPRDPRPAARVLGASGFEVMSHAGNHTMDRSELTMTDTIDAVRGETDIKVIGAGRSIKEAREPAIFERHGVKVGFLAYASVIHKNFNAAERVLESGEVRRRGGVAPLRARTFYETVDYQPGTPPRIVTQCYPEDLAALVDDVRKLKEQVDVVAVSVHWGIHFEPGILAMYQVEAAHAAIDAGCDLILGHHPHIIKGVEFYKGKPIFYAMNNFIGPPVRDEWGDLVPAGVDHDACKTFIVKCTIADKQISRVALIPCYLENSRLQPEPLVASDPRSEEIRKYMEWVCANNAQRFSATTDAERAILPFDTVFEFDGDEIVCRAGH